MLRSSAFVGIFALGSWASVGLAKGTSAAKESPSVVTYSGMAVHENRGVTLRVEMSRAVRYRHEKRGKNITILLDGATVRQRTNLFPLVAEHFRVAVLSTKLDRTRGGVRYSVLLREAVEPTVRLVEHDAGATLVVEIPPYVPKDVPAKPPESEPPAEAPAAP